MNYIYIQNFPGFYSHKFFQDKWKKQLLFSLKWTNCTKKNTQVYFVSLALSHTPEKWIHKRELSDTGEMAWQGREQDAIRKGHGFGTQHQHWIVHKSL